jgi:hypothetical protein
MKYVCPRRTETSFNVVTVDGQSQIFQYWTGRSTEKYFPLSFEGDDLLDGAAMPEPIRIYAVMSLVIPKEV